MSRVLWAVRLLLVTALAAAAYLSWKSLTQSAVAGCDGMAGMDCDVVLSTRWAKWFGLPIALLGAGTYLAALIVSFLGLRFRWLLHFLVGAAVVAAIWFTVLQAFVLGEFCPYCMTAHACGLTAGVLLCLGTMWANKQQRLHETARMGAATPADAIWIPSAVPSTSRFPLSNAGGRIFAIMILGEIFVWLVMFAGQVFGPHKTHSVAAFQGSLIDNTTPADAIVSESGQGTDSPERPPKDDAAGSVESREDRASERPYAGLRYPVMGNPHAEKQVTEFIDYTCKHCRSGQLRLRKLIETFGDQLCVVIRPVAMEKSCNSSVLRDDPRHFNACKYARYSLAIWEIRPESFEEFHEWLADGEKPPPIGEVWNRATQLVDSDDMLRAVGSEQVTGRLADDHELWRQNEGAIPMLVIGDKVLHGLPETDEELEEIVVKELSLTLVGPQTR